MDRMPSLPALRPDTLLATQRAARCLRAPRLRAPLFAPRRRWLTLLPSLFAALLSGCAAAPTAMPIANPATAHAAPSPVELGRRIDRLTWGVDTPTLQRVSAQGYGAWLHAQLHPGPAVLPPPVARMIDDLRISREPVTRLVGEMAAERRSFNAIADPEARVEARKAYQKQMQELGRETMSRSLLMALYSPNQLQEQMTWFWDNHFNIHIRKGMVPALAADFEERAIRPHALGHFRDLLRAATEHPAMLVYLDNANNAAGHINENHARELMELHTLGVHGGYSQRDVQELARILTGLGVNLDGHAPRVGRGRWNDVVERGPMEFNPNRHDYGDKVFLGRVIHGRGMAEIGQTLDILARSPATAHFVSEKMARYLLADQPSAAVVARMQQRWLATDGDIAAVLQTLFDAPEFAASLERKFRDPMHYVLASVRLAYGDNPIANTQPLLNWLNRMGELPFDHQTPDGYPLDEASWSSPGQMATRFDVARILGNGAAGLFRTEGPTPIERPAFPQLANPTYYEAIAPRLTAATQQALAQAASPQEWNTLLLASPEMMRR